MKSSSLRSPYQGVVQILLFNRRFYLWTTVAVCAAIGLVPVLPRPGQVALLMGVAPAVFWLFSSLAVSHYIYDRFPLYDLNWIARMLLAEPRRWINIHCGLDETSQLLAACFPGASGEVIDIFNARLMTEGSILEARRLRPGAIAPMRARHDSVGFASDSFDAAFLIFAAHELREFDDRVKLLREVGRVLTPGGSLILVEHSRDGWNFLAFGPGFMHFFAPRAWRKAALEAGLTAHAESSLTPFVRVYDLRRAK